MNLTYLLKTIAPTALFALFLWQTINSTLKYLDRQTVISSFITDDSSILFPSITVCMNMFNGIEESEIRIDRNSSTKIRDIVNHLHQNFWNKSEIFYFFSHPNMFNLSFPCTYMEGRGTTPGKPCTFPWAGFSGCNEEGDCLTR